MAAESKRRGYERRLAELVEIREPMMHEWRDLADFFSPRRINSLYEEQQRNNRNRRNTKIINTSSTMALRTLVSGLMSGATSPARPWFRLSTPDPDMMEFAPVKEWLFVTERILRDMFARSNFYDTLGICYRQLGMFGTMAMGMFEDDRELLRCWPYQIGGYAIANSARGSVDTLYNEYYRTVRQLVQQFGKPGKGKEPDISMLSPRAQQAWTSGHREIQVQVVHAIQPNAEWTGDYAGNRDMPISSCYYEREANNSEQFLLETGFEEMPALCFRWDVLGEDPWGTGPALDAIGDAKGLQYREKQKAQRIDKQNNPALFGNANLKNKRTTLLPGDITYGDYLPNGKPSLQPVHEIAQDIGSIREDIDSIERRISRAMYEDLFLMLSRSDRRQITAEEIARREEEKLIVLGPVVERMNNELLNPAIDRGFAMALRAGLLPPPPEELEGQQLRVVYVSLLAQSQRLVTTGAIDRYSSFIGGLAKFQADAGESVNVIDKFDIDQAADEYADALGVPPTIVRSDDQVAELRESRAQQQQAQQLAQAAQPAAQAAKAAKDLSQTEVNGRNVLEAMVG
jgi:hypothetical protein